MFEPSTLGIFVLKTVGFSVLATLVFLPLEHLVGRSTKTARVDIHFATTGKVIEACLLFLMAGLVLASVPTLWFLSELTGSLGAVGTAIEIFAGLVLFDLAGYGYHRLAHRVPALWALHRVHHSSEEMSFAAGFRAHPVEVTLMTLAQNLPLVLLGIPLASHVAVVLLLQLHTLFVHSTIVRGHTPLFALPSYHHHHHARDLVPENFATLFPWIDRLGGTYQRPVEPLRFGTHEPAPKTFLGMLFLRRGPHP